MKFIQIELFILFILVLVSCDPTQKVTKTPTEEEPLINVEYVKGKIIQEGKIIGTVAAKKADGTPYFLEPTGIYCKETTCYIGSEQPLEEKGLYQFNIEFGKKETEAELVSSEPIGNLMELQDFAKIPNTDLIVGVTGFEYQEKDGKENWLSNNVLLFWKMGSEKETTALLPSSLKGQENSVLLRPVILKALKGSKYGAVEKLKVIGLTATMDNKLILALKIDYQNNKNVNELLTIGYKTTRDGIELEENFRPLTELNFRRIRGIRSNLMVSSLAHSPYEDKLVLTTTYKEGKRGIDIGGYVWVTTVTELLEGRMPKLLGIKDNEPIDLKHKPGGVTFFDDANIIIVNDDDEVTEGEGFQRKPQDATYLLVELLEN